ncbi:MAG: hypothetical protein R3F24_08080 [Gammaproteobacteria bacterium]
MGMHVQGKSEVEERQFAIIAMDDTSVTVDQSLLRADLRFSPGTVIEVRTATADELKAPSRTAAGCLTGYGEVGCNVSPLR